MSFKENVLAKIRGYKTVEQLERLGFTHGKNFKMMFGVVIDWGHCFLVSVGDDVTIAPRCHILAHDASTKTALGYTRIAPVKIGSQVFIGAESLILPGVTIGDKVVVGACSVVTKDLEGNGVYVGNPAKRICSYDEYIERNRKVLTECPVFDESYIIDVITDERRREMKDSLSGGKQGFIR